MGVAVDAAGNVWIANNSTSTITEVNSAGTPISTAGGFTGGGLQGPESVAIDGAGNLWVTDFGGNSVTQFNSAGVPLSPPGGFTTGGLEQPSGMKKRNGASPDRRHGTDRAGSGFHRGTDVENFPAAIKREIEEKGVWLRPSQYSEGPYPITKGLIEEARKHLLLGGLIETGCPVHILQGVQDPMCRGGMRSNWCRALPATTWCSH